MILEEICMLVLFDCLMILIVCIVVLLLVGCGKKDEVIEVVIINFVLFVVCLLIFVFG